MEKPVVAVTFQQAFESVILRYSPETWQMLTPREHTAAIYREMRRMDAEAVCLKNKKARGRSEQ